MLGSGIDPRARKMFWDRSHNNIFWTLGWIPEPHYFSMLGLIPDLDWDFSFSHVFKPTHPLKYGKPEAKKGKLVFDK